MGTGYPRGECGVSRPVLDNRRPWWKYPLARPLPGGGNGDGHTEGAGSQGRVGCVEERATEEGTATAAGGRRVPGGSQPDSGRAELVAGALEVENQGVASKRSQATQACSRV